MGANISNGLAGGDAVGDAGVHNGETGGERGILLVLYVGTLNGFCLASGETTMGDDCSFVW